MKLKSLLEDKQEEFLIGYYNPGDPVAMTKLKHEHRNKIINVKDAVNIRSNDLVTIPAEFGEIGNFFDCSFNKLTSLKNAPRKVGTSFKCDDNKLTSLEGCPETMITLSAEGNDIQSLVGIHKMIKSCEYLNLNWNKNINEGGIGLILIPKLRTFTCIDAKPDFHDAMEIIKKYLGKGKAGLLDCQEELEEAGLERFATL